MKSTVDKSVLLELAQRVKALRKERKLTQAMCLNDTGINFGRIERGKRDISYSTLIKICEYFEIEPSEFFE
ncbi:helix-turn-helix transcriptional regulator [Pontimicrobium sp. SW4]|uniref:Helix-turn-helix transcriptional regulator n=1 Tax=Pontimicrobium sp. SW4 TaxID=3153519 RepID=A0AAU7BSJ8_9FLAO